MEKVQRVKSALFRVFSIYDGSILLKVAKFSGLIWQEAQHVHDDYHQGEDEY